MKNSPKRWKSRKYFVSGFTYLQNEEGMDNIWKIHVGVVFIGVPLKVIAKYKNTEISL